MENITFKYVTIYTTDGKQSFFTNVTFRKMSNRICTWLRVIDARYGCDYGDYRIDKIAKVQGKLQ